MAVGAIRPFFDKFNVTIPDRNHSLTAARYG
jgi:hypothetical protein